MEFGGRWDFGAVCELENGILRGKAKFGWKMEFGAVL